MQACIFEAEFRLAFAAKGSLHTHNLVIKGLLLAQAELEADEDLQSTCLDFCQDPVQ